MGEKQSSQEVMSHNSTEFYDYLDCFSLIFD